MRIGEIALRAALPVILPRHVHGERGRKPALTIEFDADTPPRDVLLTRRGARFHASFSRYAPVRWAYLRKTYFRSALYWFCRCPATVERASFNLSDGNMPSAARFAFSSPVGGQTPVPDATFFVSQGYQYVRKIEPAAWVNRSSTLSWRGTANGEGRLTFDAADSADPTVIPRLRLIMKLREQPDCDARLVRIEYKGADWTGVPLAGNFVGPPIPTEHWSSCKYAIDIDGETNAWSNLFVRLLMGCCVIKVESQHGYRQWYYDRLKPFENYVPVKPDMSDLLEKIDWARSHEAEARTIAAAGRELALSLDFKSVRQDAIDIIAANWKRG